MIISNIWKITHKDDGKYYIYVVNNYMALKIVKYKLLMLCCFKINIKKIKLQLLKCYKFYIFTWLVDSILDAVLTASPKRQYRGIFNPTTPATVGPEWQPIIKSN